MQHHLPASEPPEPTAKRHRAAKKRGVVLGFIGVTFSSLVVLSFALAGEVAMSLQQIVAFEALVLLCFAALWLIADRGWDRRMTWDPHFLFLPSLVGILLLATLLIAAPEVRLLVFGSFFIVLLFWVGIADFSEVVLFTVAATATYATSIALILATGRAEISWSEIFGSVIFLIGLGIYAAFVLDRARQSRQEARRLREELYRLALIDPLTELPNRRAFSQFAEAEASRLQADGGDCVMAILDLDHFKSVNDEGGHLTGDDVLRRVGSALREWVRSADVVARVGGEEFGLLLPDTAPDAALGLLDRLRTHLSEVDMSDLGISRSITLSGGLSPFANGESYLEAWRRADQALYRAKDAGRDQIHVALPEGAHPIFPAPASSAGGG